MKKLTCFLIIPLLMHIMSSRVIAEEMICSPSPCADLENHVEYSRNKAIGIVTGSFSFEKKADEFVKVHFLIDKVVKGNYEDNKKSLDFNLIINNFIVSKKNIPSEKDEYILWNDWLNNKKNEISIDAYSYQESLVSKKLLDKKCSSVDVALVDVYVGGLDNKVREATIPVFKEQKYILFLFKDISGEFTMLYPWDLNIYPVDAYESFDE